MQVSLLLFGPMDVRWHGRSVQFATKAARALLAYLAVEADRSHPREFLAALLWPDRSRRAASANLRQTLFRLRKALPDPAAQPVVQRPGHTLQFNRVAAEVDVLCFREALAATEAHRHAEVVTCAACLARLEQAVALYRGEFLRFLFFDQSELFGEWSQLKRERLHRQALHALHTLAHAAETRADYAMAQRYAHRQLVHEPWHEAAHAQYMRALAASGDRRAALAHYEACSQNLSQELGMEPSPELQTLTKQIAEGTFVPESGLDSDSAA